MSTSLLLALSVVTSGYGYGGYQYQYYPQYYYQPPIVKFFAVEPNKYYIDIVGGNKRQDQQAQTVNQFIQTLTEFNQTMKDEREQRQQVTVKPVDPDDVPIPFGSTATPVGAQPKPVGWVPPPIGVVSFLKSDCIKCHSAPKPNKGFKIFEQNGQLSVLNAEQKVKIDAAISNLDMPPNGKDLRSNLPEYRDWIYKDPKVIDYLKTRVR